MKSRIAYMLIAVLALGAALPASAQQTPDPTLSYFVPEAVPPAPPIVTGLAATAYFRSCPGNDGGSSLPNHARIKVILKNVDGTPCVGVAAANIYIKLNGGTDVQGFSGDGADSIIGCAHRSPKASANSCRCSKRTRPSSGRSAHPEPPMPRRPNRQSHGPSSRSKTCWNLDTHPPRTLP